MRRLAISVVCSLFFLAALTGCDRGTHPGRIGQPSPEFTVSDGATTVDLAQLRGKVVVLNLWATWCPPCIEELPSLLEMQRQLPNVTVIAISEDQDPDAYRRFLTRHPLSFTTVRDPSLRVNRLYGTSQIPETYIIDRQGILRRKFISNQDWTNPEIMNFLRSL